MLPELVQSPTTKASHTDLEEQEDPIREHKCVGRCGGRISAYILETCGLDLAIQGHPIQYLRSGNACQCEKL